MPTSIFYDDITAAWSPLPNGTSSNQSLQTHPVFLSEVVEFGTHVQPLRTKPL